MSYQEWKIQQAEQRIAELTFLLKTWRNENDKDDQTKSIIVKEFR